MASTSQQRAITVILAGSAFLAGLDLFIVNVAFNEIGADFGHAALGQLSWILNAYAVVYAALLVPMGRLTDRYGRKAGFVAGLAVFTLSSLACGLSTRLTCQSMFLPALPVAASRRFITLRTNST